MNDFIVSYTESWATRALYTNISQYHSCLTTAIYKRTRNTASGFVLQFTSISVQAHTACGDWWRAQSHGAATITWSSITKGSIRMGWTIMDVAANALAIPHSHVQQHSYNHSLCGYIRIYYKKISNSLPLMLKEQKKIKLNSDSSSTWPSGASGSTTTPLLTQLGSV